MEFTAKVKIIVSSRTSPDTMSGVQAAARKRSRR